MVWTIATRELKNLFLSPLAWAILAVLQLIIAYLFLTQLDTYMLLQPRLAGIEGAPGVTDIVAAPLLQTIGFLLLLIAPAITMRVFSDEKRNRTLSLLLSAPVSMTDIVVGKFLGVTLFFFLLLLMLMAMPLSLSAGTQPRPWQAGCGPAGPGPAVCQLCRHRCIHVIADGTASCRRRQHLWPVAPAVDHRLDRGREKRRHPSCFTTCHCKAICNLS